MATHVLSLGEALIDVVIRPESTDEHVGGSLLNVAIGAQGAAQWQGGVTLAAYALLITAIGFLRLRALDS